MKKIRSMNNYLFDVAAAPFVLGLAALLGIAAGVIVLIVVAIMLIVRASKKRRAAQAAQGSANTDKAE